MRAAPLRSILGIMIPVDLLFTLLGSLAFRSLVAARWANLSLHEFELLLVLLQGGRVALWITLFSVLLRRKDVLEALRFPWLGATLFSALWGTIPVAAFLFSGIRVPAHTVLYSALACVLAAWALIYPLLEWIFHARLKWLDQRTLFSTMGFPSLSLKVRLAALGTALGMAPALWMSAVLPGLTAEEFIFLLTVAIWAPMASWFFAATAMHRIGIVGRLSRSVIEEGDLSRASPLPVLRNDEIGLITGSLNEMIRRLGDSELQLKEALKAREDFIAVASHEFKTPLSSLQLNVGILRRRLKDRMDENLNAHLQLIERQVRKLSGLTDVLLDWVHHRTGGYGLKLEQVDLGELVRRVAEEMKQQLTSETQLSLRIQGPQPAMLDPRRIEQVLGNLLSNAIKYGRGLPIEVRVSGDDESVLLEVRDRGIGIPEGRLKTIFACFERAVPAEQYSGFGLGLFVVKNLVEAHQGRVTVTSRLGEGSRFSVWLPRLPADLRDVHPSASHGKGPEA